MSIELSYFSSSLCIRIPDSHEVDPRQQPAPRFLRDRSVCHQHVDHAPFPHQRGVIDVFEMVSGGSPDKPTRRMGIFHIKPCLRCAVGGHIPKRAFPGEMWK